MEVTIYIETVNIGKNSCWFAEKSFDENGTNDGFFLNPANFAQHTLLTLVPPSGYALNLKALIKVSKVSWTSQLSYEILRSSFERKFDKTNFISP